MKVEEVIELAVQCNLIDSNTIDRETRDKLLQFAGVCSAVDADELRRLHEVNQKLLDALKAAVSLSHALAKAKGEQV